MTETETGRRSDYLTLRSALVDIVENRPGAVDAARLVLVSTCEEDPAMVHLANVLTILAELHEDDRSRAFDEALKFYNEHNPDRQVAPVDGYVTRLSQKGPLDDALQRHEASAPPIDPCS